MTVAIKKVSLRTVKGQFSFAVRSVLCWSGLVASPPQDIRVWSKSEQYVVQDETFSNG